MREKTKSNLVSKLIHYLKDSISHIKNRQYPRRVGSYERRNNKIRNIRLKLGVVCPMNGFKEHRDWSELISCVVVLDKSIVI